MKIYVKMFVNVKKRIEEVKNLSNELLFFLPRDSTTTASIVHVILSSNERCLRSLDNICSHMHVIPISSLSLILSSVALSSVCLCEKKFF